MKTAVYDENLDVISTDGSKTQIGGTTWNAFQKQNYRQVQAIIRVTYTQLLQFDPSMSITTTGNPYVDYPDQTANGNENTGYLWGSLDTSLALDSTFHPVPGTEIESNGGEMGWWGGELSDGAYGFTVDQVLNVTYTQRPLKFLTLVFDTQRDEYATDFVITFYSDTVLKHTITAVTNTENTIKYNLEALLLDDIDNVVLTITKWSVAGRQVKVTEMSTIFTQTYSSDQIFGLSILEETEYDGNSVSFGNISSNQISFKLDNSDRRFSWGNADSDLHGLVRPFNTAEVWLGAKAASGDFEYLKMGVFFVEEWTISDDELYAEAVANDIFTIINQTEYTTSKIVDNVSLKELATDVLQNAGITSNYYDIDDELSDIIVRNAYIEKMKSRDALKNIAVAAVAKCYVNNLGRVRLQGPNSVVGSAYTIPTEAPRSWYRQMNNSKNNMRYKWSTADGFTSLDGTFHPKPSSTYIAELNEVGYWSEVQTLTDGTLTDDFEIILTLTPEKDIEVMNIVFDDQRDEYATEFTVTYLDYLDAVVRTDTYTSNTDSTISESFTTALQNIKTIKLNITEWNLGLTSIKVTEFNYSSDSFYRYTMSPTDYFTFDNPVNLKEIANYVKVNTFPLRETNTFGSTQIVFEDSLTEDPRSVPGLTTEEIEIKYNVSPVKNTSVTMMVVSGAGIITSANYYSWGASFVIAASSVAALTFRLSIEGIPLSIVGEETVIVEDNDSISAYGKKQFIFPDNTLIQNKSTASTIARKLLDAYKLLRAKTEISYSGNPCFNIADIINIEGTYRTTENLLVRNSYELSDGFKCSSTLVEI